MFQYRKNDKMRKKLEKNDKNNKNERLLINNSLSNTTIFSTNATTIRNYECENNYDQCGSRRHPHY